MKSKTLILMLLCLFVGFFLGVYFGSPLKPYLTPFKDEMLRKSQVEKDEPLSEPKITFPELEPFQSILGKVVFVTKGVYGGNLKYSCSLKGKIRNVTGKPYKDVFVLWMLYDENKKLFPVYMGGGDSQRVLPSIFLCKIDYLDSKSEAEFAIDLDLYSGMGKVSADLIRKAVQNGCEEAGIFIRKKSQK